MMPRRCKFSEARPFFAEATKALFAESRLCKRSSWATVLACALVLLQRTRAGMLERWCAGRLPVKAVCIRKGCTSSAESIVTHTMQPRPFRSDPGDYMQGAGASYWDLLL